MSDFNIAEKSKNNQDKVDVDLAASGVAYKECLNMSSSLENIIIGTICEKFFTFCLCFACFKRGIFY